MGSAGDHVGDSKTTGLRIVLCITIAVGTWFLYWAMYRFWTIPHELGHYLVAQVLGGRPVFASWNHVQFWGAGPVATWLIVFFGPVGGVLIPVGIGELFARKHIPEGTVFLWTGALKNYVVDFRTSDMVQIGYYGVFLYAIAGFFVLFLGVIGLIWAYVPEQERRRIMQS